MLEKDIRAHRVYLLMLIDEKTQNTLKLLIKITQIADQPFSLTTRSVVFTAKPQSCKSDFLYKIRNYCFEWYQFELYKYKWKLLSHVKTPCRLLPLPTEFSRPEYWSG